MSKATFTFGRFNPPTEEGHGKLISTVQQHAEKTGGTHYIFPSHSQDKKKNPLSHSDKVAAMHKLFPNANIVSHGKVRTAIDAMKHLEKQGHTNVTMVVGSDRVDQFHGLLSKYRKKEFPEIKKVNVISAGHRDPDAEGAEGMSASKLRDLAAAGKKKEFVSHYSDKKLGAHIHDKVKAGMQMESKTPIGIFLLGGPGSGKDYLLNNIFSHFDLTEVHSDQIISRKASELTEMKKNIVINGVADLERIAELESILEGYEFDYVHVAVTNKVSRLRNSMREHPLAENKRIDKWLKAEKLAERINCFNFNNSINLNESNELEQVLFAGQIERLLARLVEHGLEIKESSQPKSFVSLRRTHLSESEANLKNPHDVESIAQKHNVSTAVIIQALAIGKQVEMEHTNDENTAETIALAHLWEKPDYYTQLAKMEQVNNNHVAAEKKAERERRIRDTRVLTHQNRHVHDAAMGKMSEAIRRVPRSGNVTAVIKKREMNDAERMGFEQAKIQLATSKTHEEKEFPAIKKDKESGLPKKYVAGLSPSTAKARAAHWKEKEKLSDSDPKAYEPAPGDATAKTKVSKYTKKYHDMYDEAANAAQQAAIAIAMKKAGKKPKNEEVELEEGKVAKALAVGAMSLASMGAKAHTDTTKSVAQLAKERPALAQRLHDIGASGQVPASDKRAAELQRKQDQEMPASERRAKELKKEEVELEEGKYASTIAAIAAQAYEPKVGDKVRTRKGGQIPGKVEKIENNKVFFRHPEGKLYATHSSNLMREEVEQVEEGASDTSLAAKASKSGISVGTLRKVYNRGVAAWNSGHRPGTTPQQWGHARVNSYITKGKTYHTADKDLHEEEQIDEVSHATLTSYVDKAKKSADELTTQGKHRQSNDRQLNIIKAQTKQIGKRMDAIKKSLKGEEIEQELTDLDSLFEMQLVGTDEYRKHAIAMTPGQSQEIANAFSDDGKINVKAVEPKDDSSESDCGCGGDCECEKTQNDGNSSVGNNKRFSAFRKGVKEAKEKDGVDDGVETQPTLTTKHKKAALKNPNHYDYTLQGLPVTARFNALEETDPQITVKEAVEYHLSENISFTENVFRPGSEMFFEMIGEAKRLYKEGKYTPADEYEKNMLESDIGEIAEYEGKAVVLDFPIEEGLEECWTGYTQKGMKKKGNKMVPNCVPVNEEDKTEGHGIGKPWRSGGGGAVYVRTGDGGVRKINFSQSGMTKKFMDPAATRSFVARHHCLTNKDKTSRSYWACRYPRFFSNSGKRWW